MHHAGMIHTVDRGHKYNLMRFSKRTVAQRLVH